ncbi:hypothetical protein E1287_42930, partial [Actinomadura sp. KC06]
MRLAVAVSASVTDGVARTRRFAARPAESRVHDEHQRANAYRIKRHATTHQRKRSPPHGPHRRSAMHDRYRHDATRRDGHAVVIGGGMAGLISARVLTDFFDQVTILERAPEATSRPWRSGAPQSRHPHLLLAQGRIILENLFPGLHDDLRQTGTPVFDFGQRAVILTPSGLTPTVATGIICQSSSRPLLETLLYARVQALPGIVIHRGTTATGLCYNAATTTVTGVAHTRRGDHAASSRTTTELEADLIVDASGRHSRLPDWLAHHGLPRPRT